MTRTIRLVVEYDGTDFSGWQAQGDPAIRTVQGALEDVLSIVLQERIGLGVAGRTDRGVHSRGNVASLVTTNPLPLWRLARALAGLLPKDVGVSRLAVVPDTFHARFSAVERRYVYRLLDRPAPLEGRFAWWPWMRLDPEALTEAFCPLLGEHDFRAFAGRDPSNQPPRHGRCRVTRLAFVPWAGGVQLEAHANRFLYHMVRNLVGTATAITKGTRRAEDLPAILASMDRRTAGPTSPPHGLTLESVVYPDRWDPIGEVVDGWGRALS
ncbi:MAG: tRNA pseudouridine(38-40) synthase TruA [Candidatus Eisenbacteria bacterium]